MYSISKVISMLEDDNFIDASVYLSPPRDGVDSDEDSDAEEGCSANHLSSGQLQAPAEFVTNYGIDTVNNLENEVSASRYYNEEQPEAMETSDEQSDNLPTGSHSVRTLFTDCRTSVG